MPNFGMAEQYGTPCTDLSNEAWSRRARKHCPFIDSACNKKGGICSITDGATYVITCPNRFRENNILFNNSCLLVFGTNQNCIALGEVSFLKSVSDPTQSVGSIDNVLIQVDEFAIIDWFGLEIQAVYFSGASMTSEIKRFEEQRVMPEAGSRRPDYRSSGPKRLLPQLETKVPALRRWGKKMIVAVDMPFFNWMPTMKEANHISNADICWMVFELDVSDNPYRLILRNQYFTTLEESRIGLVGGEASTKPDFESELFTKMADLNKIVWRS